MFDFPVTRRISQLPRYQEIVSTFVRHGFGFALDLVPASRRWRRRLRPLPVSEPKSLPVHFRQALEELGPTFVKLGQVLSTRPDLLPPAYITELSLLQDEVPPLAWDEIQDVLEEELREVEQTFRHVEPQPKAAASLGQVHTATLPDGTDVVIKIQRPNIRKTIETDLSILHDIARYAQRHTPLGQMYHPEEIAEDFANTLREEMNYLREGRNADRFRENFRREPDIYIPRVYWSHTTRRMLTLERIEGIKIDNIEAIDAAGFDRSKIAEHAARLSIQEILVDGFFHADPHPGNLVVMDDGALGVMDFGMVGHLSDQDRIDLIRIYTVAVRMDAEGLVDELIHIGAAPADVDRSSLTRDLNRLMLRYHDLPLKAIQANEVMREIRPIIYEYHLHLPTNLWLLSKSLTMMEGIGRRLDPNFDIFAFSRPYVNRLIREVVLPNRRQLERLLHKGMVWGDLLDEIPRTGLALLNRLENKEPIPLSIDKQNLDRLDTLATRLALSLIITGMTIGIALVMPTLGATGPWLRTILVISFVIALGLGLGVIITIFRKQ
mgnify:CR=1 FL=1